ncbi:hypothetical protein [Streptomyces sp. NPDC048577]|uniref:hypothetical protein n=1 Tax=Streptomyces sp. NPDC048577 TaxID=3157209 RepID=UPI0034158100
MQSHSTLAGTGISPNRPTRVAAEAALVEHYARLARLAHLILPPALGRHRRVLATHALVQKSWSGARRTRPGRTVPAPRGGAERPPDRPIHADPGPVRRSGAAGTHMPGDGTDRDRASVVPHPPEPRQVRRRTAEDAHAWLREQVVKAALRAARRSSRFRPVSPLPTVLGLRLFPRAGGADELALDRELARATPEVRAAFALRVLEGLTERGTAELLATAGVADPDAALRGAESLRATVGPEAEPLLQGAEFDPCTVQTRPTDLLGRRRRVRLVAVGAVVLLAGAATTAALLPPGPAKGAPTEPVAVAALARAADPDRLVRAPEERWADTGRVDFTAWPARGARADDRALLARALDAWVRGAGGRAGPPGLRLSAAADTRATPPMGPARLLFAGDVDAHAVVLLHDGVRLARYAEPLSGRGPVAFDLARSDDADVTTGAAVVAGRSPEGVRFLLAPWIAESSVRDLLRPDSPARRLGVSRDGVTEPVPGAPAGCDRAPVLQLRSSTRIVEDHSFLLADLGEVTPVHLTWTPAPGTGAPARQPREATSAAGLRAWARTACVLPGMRGTGVRAVNRWEFARQSLPERAGAATWTCVRADTWAGRGRVTVALEEPTGRNRPVTGTPPPTGDTAACGRFGQHLLAGTYWTAPSGVRYYLAAGSRHLTAVTVRGAVSATARGPALAVRSGADGPVRLTGRLSDGAELRGRGG